MSVMLIAIATIPIRFPRDWICNCICLSRLLRASFFQILDMATFIVL